MAYMTNIWIMILFLGRIVIKVRDNCNNIVFFQCIFYYFQRKALVFGSLSMVVPVIHKHRKLN